MSRISGPLSALTAAALSLASVSAMAIEPFQAKYQANYQGAQATGTMTLTQTGDNQWTYNLDIKNIFGRTQPNHHIRYSDWPFAPARQR
ncbi:hypothetical protein [Xanthomonas graminis]|uniref:hypothetical protein n=1 Tax=Xanthomonas graminis TaxID=3390026 RepID=UPI002540791C|nr:hypothetical protein [Xanthomonas translucens]